MSGKPRLTSAIINDRLSIRNIQLIGPYTNNSTPTLFLCIGCRYEWIKSPKLILRGIGCPICDLTNRRQGAFSFKITNEEIDVRLLKFNTNIIRLDNYIGVKRKLNWKCGRCDHVWCATTDNILNRKTGCPNCSRLSRGSNRRNSVDWIIESLNNRQITLIDHDYKGAKLPILVECQICKYQWYGRIDTILNGGCGCNICSTKQAADNAVGGYNISLFERIPELKDIPALLYVYEVTTDNEHFYKVGITKNTIKQRIGSTFKPNEYNIIYSINTTLYSAFILEQTILSALSNYRYYPNIIFDGRTECVKICDYVCQYLTNILTN